MRQNCWPVGQHIQTSYNRNPYNRGAILKMSCFINPNIARITVIEVPIIEDYMY